MPLRKKITKAAVDALKPAKADVVMWDTELKGFCIKVRPTGRKTYQVRYRANRTQRMFTIGTHGSPWTPDMAREEALSILTAVTKGGDPQTEKGAMRQDERRALTVNDLIDRYLEQGPRDKPDKRARSWETDRINLQRHVRPLLGRKRLLDLKPADISEWQEAVAVGKTARDVKIGPRARSIVRGGKGVAARAIRSFAAMLQWGVNRDLMTVNPASKVAKLRDGRRERFLDADEAAALWNAIAAMEADGRLRSDHAAIFRLIMLTGARAGEIVGLRPGEVHLRQNSLILPPARHKAGDAPKAIELPPAAKEIAAKLPKSGNFVFPNGSGLAPVSMPKRPWKAVCEAAGLPGLRLHDLRHSFASFALEDGVSLAQIARMLGHKKPATTDRYAHIQQTTKARIAAGVESRYLPSAGLVEGEPAEAVER